MMTKKEMYGFIATALEGVFKRGTSIDDMVDFLEMETSIDDMVDFLHKEIDRLNRPHSKSTAPTAKQLENGKLMDKILEIMREIGEPMTVSMIQKKINEIENAEYSNQKINSLMIKLQKTHEVEKFTKDKKTYFLEIVPEGNEEEEE
jgi:hypothetical protein